MNDIYQKVLDRMKEVDPALGEAILNQALKAVGTTPDEVTPKDMQEAYEQHLAKTLKKYPDSPKVKAVKNVINAMNTQGFGGSKREITAAAKGESLGTGHITEVLYAQPVVEEPFLVLKSLKEGTYETGTLWGLRTILRFTKVGNAFWNAMNKASRKAMIKLDDYSSLEEDKAWTISIMSKELSLTLVSMRYRPFANFPAAFTMKITLDGDAATAKKVVGMVVDELGYVPCNITEWDTFEKKTRLGEGDVKRAWGKFL